MVMLFHIVTFCDPLFVLFDTAASFSKALQQPVWTLSYLMSL